MPRLALVNLRPEPEAREQAEVRAREIRRLKPMGPVRSYTVVLIGLLVFTVALVVFLISSGWH